MVESLRKRGDPQNKVFCCLAAFVLSSAHGSEWVMHFFRLNHAVFRAIEVDSETTRERGNTPGSSENRIHFLAEGGAVIGYGLLDVVPRCNS